MAEQTLSVIIPVYSGEAYLRETVMKVASVSEAGIHPDLDFLECILVLDDPVDGSKVVAKELEKEFSWVSVVELSTNCGQHAATVAGICYSSGHWVATIDEDGQHDPSFIGKMYEVAAENSGDIVFARPEAPPHGGGWRDWASKTAKKFTSKLVGDPMIPHFNSFRLIRGEVARTAAAVYQKELYFDVTLGWFSKRFDSITIPLDDLRYQSEGASGYNLIRLLSHWKKLFMSYQFKWLRACFALGMVFVFASISMGVWLGLMKFLNPERIPVQGWTSLMMGIMFFGGIQILILSLVFERLSLNQMQQLGVPPFLVVNRSARHQKEL